VTRHKFSGLSAGPFLRVVSYFLKKEAAGFFDALTYFCLTTTRHVPEDSFFHSDGTGKLKYHIIID
jgi:hypothetical protein